MRFRIEMRLTLVAATLLAVLLIPACVKEVEYLNISDVVARRGDLNGQLVRVRGFVVVDALDYPNFLEQLGPPSGERITKSIDLVPSDRDIEAKLLRSNGACIIATGTFHLYGPNEVHLGNLVSEYGQLQATSLHSCQG